MRRHHDEGRTIFGVGRGYLRGGAFGTVLDHANRELFEEQVDIMFKALTTSGSRTGKHYTLPRVPYRGYTLKDLTLVRGRSIGRSNAGSRWSAHRRAGGLHGEAQYPGAVGSGAGYAGGGPITAFEGGTPAGKGNGRSVIGIVSMPNSRQH